MLKKIKMRAMKFACLIVVLIMATACTEDKDILTTNKIEVTPESLTEMAYATLNYAASSGLVNVINQDNEVTIAIKTIEEKTDFFLRKDYFSGLPEEFNALLTNDELKLSTLQGILDNLSRKSNARQSEILTGFVGSADLFSNEQMIYIEQFIAQVNLSDDISNAQTAIDYFNNSVERSTLTEDEKIILYGFSASNQSLITFYDNGGIDAAYNEMSQQLGLDPTNGGRVEGCTVSFRSVWLGAVVGGVVTGTTGAIVGATAGTFTVPILGTAVGGIGGAVFGFTSGFIGGALTSVATELLSTCFRGEPEMDGKIDASCELMQERYGFGDLPMICYENIIWKIGG